MATTEMGSGKLIVPPANEAEQIDRLSRELLNPSKRAEAQYLLVDREQGIEMELPHSLFLVLVDAVRELDKGNSVAILHYEQELTTQQTADLLHVSRPYLIRLLENGMIRYHKVGTHRRIRLRDAQEYQRIRDARRRAELQKMVRVTESLGLYDGENEDAFLQE